MSERLPEGISNPQEDGGDETTKILNIGEFHVHGSDIDALRRLAQVDPELARIVTDQKETFDQRAHASLRFGMISAAVIAVTLIVTLTIALVQLGVLLSFIMLMLVLALGVVIRVLLTGEWSETTWAGTIVNGLVKILGGNPKRDDDD